MHEKKHLDDACNISKINVSGFYVLEKMMSLSAFSTSVFVALWLQDKSTNETMRVTVGSILFKLKPEIWVLALQDYKSLEVKSIS